MNYRKSSSVVKRLGLRGRGMPELFAAHARQFFDPFLTTDFTDDAEI